MTTKSPLLLCGFCLIVLLVNTVSAWSLQQYHLLRQPQLFNGGQGIMWLQYEQSNHRNQVFLQDPQITTRISNTARSSTTILQMSIKKGRKAQERKVNYFIRSMNEPIRNIVNPDHVLPQDYPEYDDLADFVRCIVKAADLRKAENINAIRISKLTATTEFIVVLSGNSRPQNQAIASSIMNEITQSYNGRRTKSGVAEGNADSGWILLDYGDVIVHIMTPKSRLFYDIEGLWPKGEVMDLSDVLIPNTVPVVSLGKDGLSSVSPIPGQAAVEEDDPFWS